MNQAAELMKNARESLEAARYLLDGEFYGFAASRAYFAMFSAASALLALEGRRFKSHSAVISAFGREYAKTRKLDPDLHGWLMAAQNFREVGDYGVEARVTIEQATQACEWAAQFVLHVERFLVQPTADSD